jgi:hypothetical protein
MTNFTRRQVLGGLGGLAAVTLGLGAFAERGAALRTNFIVDDATVATDTGDVSRVFIRPAFDVRWAGFEEPVGRVRILVEAKVRDDETYQPVFQMTPVLDDDAPFGSEQVGTSGYYIADEVDRWWEITLFDELGRPPYEDLTGYPDGYEAYLDGTVLGDATEAPTWNGDPFANNEFGATAGYYGAAGTTDVFESNDDGGIVSTDVDVRVTISLLAPLGTATADHKVLMYNTGEHPVVRDPTRTHTLDGSDVVDPRWLTYADLRALHDDGHPAVEVVEATFAVRAVNEQSENGAVVDGNSGAEGRDVVGP